MLRTDTPTLAIWRDATMEHALERPASGSGTPRPNMDTLAMNAVMTSAFLVVAEFSGSSERLDSPLPSKSKIEATLMPKMTTEMRSANHMARADTYSAGPVIRKQSI